MELLHHFLLLLFFCLCLLSSPCLSWNYTFSPPPPGNSLALKTKALNGIQFYRCVDGDWILESTYATLVDFYDNRRIVGNYSRVKNPRVPKYAGIWYLYNTDGDLAESGSPYSAVAGKKVASGKPSSAHDLPDFLALASMHEFEGAASMVSYIARVNTKGGVPLDNGYCDWQNKLIKLPFQAEFHFWKQELIPPSTPNSLAVVTARPIQGFFGQGLVTYVFNGNQWIQKNTVAKLYDVPGGTQVGIYYVKSAADFNGGSFCWRIYNPNGFEIVGKHACNPVQVSPGCLPWSLSVVTTSNGNMSMFGPYTHVQMVSTTGGLPPSNEKCKPRTGQVWKAPYSAIYWFYCKI